LVSSEVLQNLAGVHRLAVVGEGASAAGVVCAFNHDSSLAQNPAASSFGGFAFGIGVAIVRAVSPCGAQYQGDKNGGQCAAHCVGGFVCHGVFSCVGTIPAQTLGEGLALAQSIAGGVVF
jgi:hypothetical protein